ncbi:MAG: F0F1 ATP synthase subunit A [Anaerolineales bacterium]|nr:F0F1 ATP synthase subunit A [Anaerolineales bacterium]
MAKEEATRKWKYGVSRWIALAIIVVSVIVSGKIPPLRPYIALPAEHLTETLFQFPLTGEAFFLTNTMTAVIIADIFILGLAFFVLRPAFNSGKHVFKGIVGAVQALVEGLYNLTEETAGKWTRTIVPIFATLTLLILTVNWMELIPGVDSIGVINAISLEHAHHVDPALHFETDCDINLLFTLGNTQVVSIGGENTNCAAALAPFVRAAATDLNFTLGLAIMSFLMIQIIGVRAQGLSYFEKFINIRALGKPGIGKIDFVVGIFEIVSEFSKIISFSFRLFGNIFAGMILLLVIGTLIPVAAQTGVLMLEFGVGLIQAVVFGMLTMIFMAQATQSHHGDEEHH